MENIMATVKQGTSKAGKPYEALEVQIGDYSALIFPTKIEMLYIKNQLGID